MHYVIFQYIIFFVAFVIIVLWGISIYLLKTKKLQTADWLKHSLGIPTGSVRALIAFVLIFLVLFPIVTKQPLPDLPDWLVGILGAVIGFYFGSSGLKAADKTVSTTQGQQGGA